MASENVARGERPGNPPDIDSLLDFREAALRVVDRADIGAVELRLIDPGKTVSAAVLAPAQSLALVDRLVQSALRVVATGAGGDR
jgi:hypothetical protein